MIHLILELITYLSFIFFGILTLIQKDDLEEKPSSKNKFLQRLVRFGVGYILMIAFSIAIGEFGDKTFLASLGLGINYPKAKLALMVGAILGMVASDSIAILFGKFLKNHISSQKMNFLSGILFLVLGCLGLLRFFITFV